MELKNTLVEEKKSSSNLSQYKIEQNEIQELIELGKSLKSSSLDFFIQGSYCDAIDETKKWCIAEIIERNGDEVIIHFEGWSDNHNKKVNIKKASQIAHFRKHSKNYTGQVKTAYRIYEFVESDYIFIKNWIKKIVDTNFECFESANEATQILRGKIFTYLDIFMTTNYSQKSSKIIPLIVSLLYDFIDLVVAYFEYYIKNAYLYDALVKYPDLYLVSTKCAIVSAIPEIVFSLKRIFGCDNRISDFYRSNDIIIKKIPTKAKQKFCLEQIYKSNSNFEKDSFSIICIVNYIDYFFSKGGLKLINDAITSQRENQVVEDNKVQVNNSIELYFKVPIFVITPFLQILTEVEYCLSKKINIEAEYFKFQEVMKLRLNFLTSLEIKETKKQLIFITAGLMKNAISNYDKRQAGLIYEEIILIYYFKCFTSKILSKKIQGITAISNVIEALEKKERKEYTSKEKKTEEENQFELINREILIKFMNDKQIVDNLLGDGIHEEILKKSFPVFRYLANNNALNKNNFDLLWKNYSEKHETISLQIENIICGMSTFLNSKDKIMFYEKVISNFTENEKNINLIKKYTIGCLKSQSITASSKETEFYGIPLLWKLICTGETKEIIELAVDNFCDIFFQLHTIDDSIKEKYLKLCFNNILKNTAVISSIKIIQKLMTDLIDGGKSNKQISKIIRSCDEQYSIASLIITNLIQYATFVKKTFISIQNEEESKKISQNPLNNIFDSFYTYQENLTTRLEAINYLLSDKQGIFKIQYTFENIELIWNSLVVNFTFEEESKFFYKFLMQKRNESSNNVGSFIQNISELLFKNILCDKEKFNYSVESFCPTSFTLFKTFFISVNKANNKLINDPMKLRVHTMSLIGVESLLDILCFSQN